MSLGSKFYKNLEAAFPQASDWIISWSFLYLSGLVLFVLGFSLPYSVTAFSIYSIALITWGAFCVWRFGVRASLEQSLFAWICFFLFFPKQRMRADGPEALFNLGFSKNLFEIGFYQILEFLIFFALTSSLVRLVLKNRSYILPTAVKFMLLVIGLIVVKSFIQVGFSALKFPFPLQAVLETLPFFYIMVLILAVYLSIKRSSQIDFIAAIFVFLGSVLLVEYVLVKFNFLPIAVYKYTFNYRNGFKSGLMANDLEAGLFLIACASSALYYYFSKKKPIFLFLFISSSFLMVETLNRAHWVPFLTALVILGVLQRRFKELVACVLIFAGVIFPISERTSNMAPPGVEKIWLARSNGGPDAFIQEHYVYAHGRLASTESFKERIGAVYRGVDLFLNFPILGVGPGNVPRYMSDSQIPTKVNIDTLDTQSGLAFYNLIKSGAHVTNTHNLYAYFLAEHGMNFVLLVVALLLFFKSEMYKSLSKIVKDRDSISMSLLIAPLAFLGYYMFQATPPSSILLFFLWILLFIGKVQAVRNSESKT
ncbi:hypothetical protein AZI86_10975 [Bdellovibrio bacteriovorus]|uniref:O-antigen ligase-related domain-containing protein n=1 Tax=Bdellovibrio bacteriovorus TaxID=959 RepID=A0A150WLA7_BDEBC|nr:O-antigen ligase family protein [Bdellovibrio bacteriovorus]KYG64724.1 hypothetical protein AZI86_10975 [Bdellovibrio bacteriovorus]